MDLLDKMFDRVERLSQKIPVDHIAAKLGLKSAASDRCVQRWVRESSRMGWLEITLKRFGVGSDRFLVTRYDRNARITRAATVKSFVV